MGARKKITWERESSWYISSSKMHFLSLFTKNFWVPFWRLSSRRRRYLYWSDARNVVRNKCHMIRLFFSSSNWFFSLKDFSKNILALMMMNKSFSLVAWWFFGSLHRGGCYETTTTESFDGSNKTEVVGGRFFEAAAAVKACENLLGFGLGGLRRQTRVKQN